MGTVIITAQTVNITDGLDRLTLPVTEFRLLESDFQVLTDKGTEVYESDPEKHYILTKGNQRPAPRGSTESRRSYLTNLPVYVGQLAEDNPIDSVPTLAQMLAKVDQKAEQVRSGILGPMSPYDAISFATLAGLSNPEINEEARIRGIPPGRLRQEIRDKVSNVGRVNAICRALIGKHKDAITALSDAGRPYWDYTEYESDPSWPTS